GRAQLAALDTDSGKLENFDTPYTDIWGVHARPGRVVFGGGSPSEPASVVMLDPVTRRLEVLKRASDVRLDEGFLSIPRAIEFPTEHGKSAHAFFYAPHNRDFEAPQHEKPPLLVKVHGGPTGSTSTTFNLS